MSRKFIATILAASIAVTSLSARPAAALTDEQLGALLFGGIALAVIGKAASKRRSEPEIVTPPRRDDRYYPHPPRHRDVQPPRYRADRKLLPANCLRTFDQRRGQVRMFGARCLQRDFRYSNRLPNACRISARTTRGVRHGYTPHGLRRHGYRMASW